MCHLRQYSTSVVAWEQSTSDVWQDPKAKLELKSNKDKGVYVKDLTNIVVKTVAEIDHVLEATPHL